MPDPFQFLLLLDVDKTVDEKVITVHLPDRRADRKCFRLTDLGLERRPGVPRNQLDWARISAALASMLDEVRTNWPEQGSIEVYVAGFAPLSIFFAVGTLLDARGARVVGLQPHKLKPDEWQSFDLTAGEAGASVLEARGVSGDPAESTGHVAIFISTLGVPVLKHHMRAAVQAHGDDLAGVATLDGPRVEVGEDNLGQLVHQLERFFVDLTAVYPYRTGVTLFLAAPSCLALAAGLALNPNQFLGEGRSIELTEFAGGVYNPVFRLPLEVAPDTSIPDDAESVLQRLRAFGHFKRGVKALQEKLARETVYMPSGFGGAGEASRQIADNAFAALRDLRLPDEPQGEAFEIDGLEGILTIGSGLLHPLAELPSDTLARLGQLFTLHEVVHADQGIESHNYRGIGRSGVVLEDVDFWADAFAIGTAALHEVLRNGPAGEERCSDILIALIDAHIAAMRAFDKMEQGSPSLRVMPERRLRRYLIWYMQRARARAVRKPEHIRALLNDRLFVELAPLRGRLDERYDKIVESGIQTTTLSFSIGGRAKRMAGLPQNFSPAELVGAMRDFDEERIDRAMRYVISENRALLVPWGA